jgi:sugar phosphate isomerase/epimerase
LWYKDDHLREDEWTTRRSIAMTQPVALQLYSVRNLLAKDFAGTVRKVADLGFAGVEALTWFPGVEVGEAARQIKALGLDVAAVHSGIPVGDKKNEVIDQVRAFGAKRMVSGLGADRFKTAEDIRKACDLFNEAGAFARQNGMQFGIHNHWWEMEPVGGVFPYQVMLERLDKSVFFEVDVYWVKVAGLDPVKVVAEVGARAPLLHIKDGPGVKGQPHTAVGDGVVDIPAVVKAGPGAEWLIVELDDCATDMMEAVGKSLRYLESRKLGKGKASAARRG